MHSARETQHMPASQVCSSDSMGHRNVTVDRADFNVQESEHLGIPHVREGL